MLLLDITVLDAFYRALPFMEPAVFLTNFGELGQKHWKAGGHHIKGKQTVISLMQRVGASSCSCMWFEISPILLLLLGSIKFILDIEVFVPAMNVSIKMSPEKGFCVSMIFLGALVSTLILL